MRIAFVNQPWNPVVPPVEAGSIAIWTYEVARRLARDHEVTLYSMRVPGQAAVQAVDGIDYRRFSVRFDRWIERMQKRWRAQTRWFSTGRGTPLFGSSAYYLGYALRIARDLRSRSVDVVHVHNLVQFAPVIRALNPNATIILHMHAEWLNQLPLHRARRWLNAANIIAGCSEHLSGLAQARFPALASRCQTIYNAVDPSRFSPSPEKGAVEEVRLLYVGRISPEKGIHVLLDAFARVRAACPDVRLEVIGPDSATPQEFLVRQARDASTAALKRFYPRNYLVQLREQSARLGFADGQVDFEGPVPHGLTPDRYRRATLLVNPSLSESFGMSLIEAMACGLPVVASKVGGMVEVVDHQRTGVLVPPDDPAALANAVLELIRDGSRRQTMGEEGRRRVLERFTWERVSEKLVRQYREAIDRR